MDDPVTLAMYDALPKPIQQRIREKCRHEGMTILAVMQKWPSLWKKDA